MTYVLLLCVLAWDGSTSLSQEFNDEQACIVAGEAFKQRITAHRVYEVTFTCVPKGTLNKPNKA